MSLKREDIQLGLLYQDQVTGFVGYAVAVIDYIEDVTRVELQPTCVKSHVLPEAQWFPLARLELAP